VPAPNPALPFLVGVADEYYFGALEKAEIENIVAAYRERTTSIRRSNKLRTEALGLLFSLTEADHA
jgi:hypothetical protein